ncbi:phage coat protein, partial [Vibrio parahaemolyticus]|nr:phage coat protein [Vibrio parahaemolyticus]
MKYINKAKKFAKRGAVTMAVAALSLPAFAESGAADPFSA